MAPPVQHASVAAWRDERHVAENRDRYREKFDAVIPILDPVLGIRRPDAGFYLWAEVPGGPGGPRSPTSSDEHFARELYRHAHVAVLPGSYLARETGGVNPGRGYVRIALVPDLDTCVEAAERIAQWTARNLDD